MTERGFEGAAISLKASRQAGPTPQWWWEVSRGLRPPSVGSRRLRSVARSCRCGTSAKASRHVGQRSNETAQGSVLLPDLASLTPTGWEAGVICRRLDGRRACRLALNGLDFPAVLPHQVAHQAPDAVRQPVGYGAEPRSKRPAQPLPGTRLLGTQPAEPVAYGS